MQNKPACYIHQQMQIEGATCSNVTTTKILAQVSHSFTSRKNNKQDRGAYQALMETSAATSRVKIELQLAGRN